MLRGHQQPGWIYRTSERGFEWVIHTYGRSLRRVLDHPYLTLAVLLATIGLNVYLFIRVPKGFFPQQDNGRLGGTLIADQDTSFQSMVGLLQRMDEIVQEDPAVDTVTGSTGGSGGGSTLNQARVNIQLKPLAGAESFRLSSDGAAARLPKLAVIRGGTLYLQAFQDVRIGGRSSAALYQFTMRGDNLQDLNAFGRPMLEALRKVPLITDVNTDQQNNGLEAVVQYDRETAARFGVSSQLLDNVLYDAFGQRQVSNMYTALNQYHVVMEVAPRFWQNPETLRDIYVQAPASQLVPLNAIAHFGPSTAPLAVSHQGLFPAVTLSFNLAPGASLGDAVDAIGETAHKVGLPPSIQTVFAGTAQAYQDSLGSESLLIAAALFAVYIVLGMLYESYVHPITLLSTLPSAGGRRAAGDSVDEKERLQSHFDDRSDSSDRSG